MSAVSREPSDPPAGADGLTPLSTLGEITSRYPGARRALFRAHHIGGCASCGFTPEETLQAVCRRNDADPADALESIRRGHAEEEKLWIGPAALAEVLRSAPGWRLIDLRTRAEHEAVALPGSELLTPELSQSLMGGDRAAARLVFYDHLGDRVLDAASYFIGHGFSSVRALRGGIEAWAVQVDPALPRYRLE